MNKIYLLLSILLIGILISIFTIRKVKADEIVSLIVLVDEKESPLDSLPIEKHVVDLDNRTLAANFLKVNDQAPSVFICTGNGEALYEWLPVQSYLKKKGFSSYVFSYSGFGNSTGVPTETSLVEDALAAYQQFVRLTPKSKRRIAMSHSLGCVPLHGIADQMDPPPSKLVIHASFSSIRNLLVDLEMTSSTWKWLWPDIWNNLGYASKNDIPTLYVHSRNDKTVPYQHSLELAEVTGNNASILLLDNYGHNAIYQNVSDSLYQPLLLFMGR